MKVTAMRPVELDIAYIRVVAGIRHGTEDMPADFPFRNGDTWDVLIDINSGRITGWPEGTQFDLCIKVVDCGSYYLLDSDLETVESLENDYVPNGIIPGSYGDYIECKIQSDGTIAEWPKTPDFEAFFSED